MVKWSETIDQSTADRARDLLREHGMAEAAITVVPGIVGASMGPASRAGYGPAVFLAISIAKDNAIY